MNFQLADSVGDVYHCHLGYASPCIGMDCKHLCQEAWGLTPTES